LSLLLFSTETHQALSPSLGILFLRQKISFTRCFSISVTAKERKEKNPLEALFPYLVRSIAQKDEKILSILPLSFPLYVVE
jgi:hypothetical protein